MSISLSSSLLLPNLFLSSLNLTLIILELARPLLLQLNLTTQEEAERLYYQALAEMMQDDFCALWYFLTAWGKKSDSFVQN